MRRRVLKTSPRIWHERDISHSSVERIILPDSTTLVDYMPEQDNQPPRHNVRLYRADESELWKSTTGGLVFSGQLLLDLVGAWGFA